MIFRRRLLGDMAITHIKVVFKAIATTKRMGEAGAPCFLGCAGGSDSHAHDFQCGVLRHIAPGAFLRQLGRWPAAESPAQVFLVGMEVGHEADLLQAAGFVWLDAWFQICCACGRRAWRDGRELPPVARYLSCVSLCRVRVGLGGRRTAAPTSCRPTACVVPCARLVRALVVEMVTHLPFVLSCGGRVLGSRGSLSSSFRVGRWRTLGAVCGGGLLSGICLDWPLDGVGQRRVSEFLGRQKNSERRPLLISGPFFRPPLFKAPSVPDVPIMGRSDCAP